MEKKWDMVKYSKNMSNFWEAVGFFRPRKQKRGGNIKGEEWVGHFKKLLGAEDTPSRVENGINMGSRTRVEESSGEIEEDWNREIGLGEVEVILRKMKNKKTPEEDGISTEFLKALPEVWIEELINILNGLWLKGELVDSWQTARIVPIYKGGEENYVGNYWGISLLHTGYKLLTNIIAARIRLWTEEKKVYRESQAGFRGKKGTRDQIFVLNSLIGNKLKNPGGKLYTGFIDFKTAFDVVDRKILLDKLEKLGLKGRILNMIENIQRNTK